MRTKFGKYKVMISEREVVGLNPGRTNQGVKNGKSSSLAFARIKGVVLGR